MRRNRRIATAVALVALVAVGGLVYAGSSRRTPITDPVTLRFKASVDQETSIDSLPTGTSLGYRTIRSLTATSAGVDIGTLGLECSIAKTGHIQVACTGTLRLDGGQVTIQTLYERDRYLAGNDVRVAVTGGTGSYLNAGGDGTLTRVSDNVQRYTITVNPLA